MQPLADVPDGAACPDPIDVVDLDGDSEPAAIVQGGGKVVVWSVGPESARLRWSAEMPEPY